jgi:hypothetical protein
MQAVLTTYFVISPLPVVVEDEVDEALSYAPGSVFQALSSNYSIVRLLENGQIIEDQGTDPTTGYIIIQGPTGPSGALNAGWIDVGPLVRLVDIGDQVSAGTLSPPGTSKFTIDAAAGGYTTGLLVTSGVISSPGGGVGSERFGLGSLAAGANGSAFGNAASAAGTSSSAGGNGAVASAAFGTAWGAASSAALDSTALGAGAAASQGGTAVGRSSDATGLRSFSGGIGATNIATDTVLVGANGNVAAAETVAVGADTSVTQAGGQAVGYSATVSGVDASAWGRGATATFANSHAWGAGAVSTATNQFVVGSQANPIGSYHFGRGEAATVKQDVTISSTRIGTTQIDEAGSNLTIVAGPGTGNATPSKIFFQAAPAVGSGNTQQPLATQMAVGVGVDVTNWLNVGTTASAVAVGDVAASDGTNIFFWDASVPQLNLGVEGAVTLIRGIDSASATVAGGSLHLTGGTGLTTGPGGSAQVVGGTSGPTGIGGLAALTGGIGIVSGGPVEITGGTAVGAPGGTTTIRGGPGTTAGNLLAHGGITNNAGGQSGTGTFSGGNASATLISIAGDGILKGGDGVSNNNNGANALIRGGIGFGAGTHGYVQVETSGVGRWQVNNSGHFLAVTDSAYDIGTATANRPRDLFVARNAVIDGNLTVNGTQTIVDTELQTADNYILLNSEYTSDAPQTAGLVLNIDPAATSFSISGIATNIVTVAAGDPSLVLAAGDFVLIQNPATADNAGVYEVLSTTISTITVDTTPIEPFSGTGLVDDATAQGTIVGVGVAVWRSSTTGVFEGATGTAAPLIYSVALGSSSITLTSAFGATQNTTFAEAEVDFSVSGTATGLIPAGALPLGVTTRVLTTISGGGATGYEIGDGSDVNRWGSIASTSIGTTSDAEDFTDNTLSFNNSASAADVVLTGIGGTPTAGTVRVSLAYTILGAPTS